MKNKLVKSMTMIIAIAMLVSMVPAMASGTASVAIKDVDIVDGTVTVTYDAAGLTEFTLLAVRDTYDYESVEDLPAADADLEKQIEYIDQPTLSGDVTDATFTFKLRDRSSDALAFDGQYVNVLLGGEGVDAVVDYYKEKLAAPEIEDPAELTVFSDEDIVFAVPDGTAAWATGAAVYVNDATEPYADALAADGQSITISSDVNVTKIEVKNEDYNDAKWAGTVTVLDRLTEAKKAIETATVVYDTDSDSDDVLDGTAKITIPENITDSATDVAIAYTLKKGDADVEVTDYAAIVDRPAQDATEPDVYTLVATLSHASFDEDVTVESTISIRQIGADGYTITAENITLTAEAYGIAGAKVVTVKIESTEIDETNQVVKVNGTALYYAPERSTGSNDVFVGIVRENNADADAVAAVSEIADEIPVSIYYGKVGNPTDGTTSVIGTDAAAAKRMNKDSVGYSDAEYLVFDIYGTGKVEGTTTACIVRANKKDTDKKSEFSIISDN